MTEKKLYNKKEDNLSDANYEINLNSGFCKKNDISQMNRFKNKFAVVTGANGDFGKFCAEKLAEEGCSVILWDLESTETLKSSLNKKPANTAPIESTNKGNSIIIGDSCVSSILIFLLLYSP